MPDNVQIGAFVLGAVLLLLSVVGGNLEIFGAKIAEKISNPMRGVSGVLGVFFVIVGLLDPFSRLSSPTQSISPTLSATNNPIAEKATAPASPTLASNASVSISPTVAPSSIPAVTSSSDASIESIEINRKGNSPLAGYSVTVTTIELRTNSIMRWNLLFSNESNGVDNITIDYTKSFVVDEQGNRYNMVQDSVNTSPTGAFKDKLPSHTRLNYWAEFPAPTNGTKGLTLVLERSGVGPPFPSMAVSLGKIAFPTIAPTSVPEGTVLRQINLREESPLAGYSVTTTTIELRTNSIMRWNLLFSNESNGADNITIDYTKSFVVDEQGNHYNMVQDSANTSPTGAFGDKLPSRTRLNYWVEFPAPANDTKELTLVLERSGVGPPFPPIVVKQ